MKRSQVNAERKTDRKAAFLTALRATGIVGSAAKAVGIGRNTAYEWRNGDEAFAKEWDFAVEDSTDDMEQEALRRAGGFDKPVFQGGKQVGVIREHSDLLLIFMLKARRPEKFRDRYELTGKDGGPLQLSVDAARVLADPKVREAMQASMLAGAVSTTETK